MVKRKQLQHLGRRVRELRKDRNLSQAELAERANLTTNYIGKIERGEAHPTIEALLAIAEGLKVNVSELFRHLDRPVPKEDVKRRIWEMLETL